MLLHRRFKFFLRNESGVATTEFLVLTSILIGITLLSLNVISEHSGKASTRVASDIDLMDDEL